MPESRKLSVFLSHASEDKKIVRELSQQLAATGWIDPWLDEERLLPGQVWERSIEGAIDAADIVIFFLSENSVNKEGYVQRELKRALNRSLEKREGTIFLIPFRLDDCEIPYELKDRQYANYFGTEKEKTYTFLLRALEQRRDQKRLQEEKEQKDAQKIEAELHQQTRETLLQGPSEPGFQREDQRKDLVFLNDSALQGIVHYAALGHGRPVIFLHSWVGSWRYWFDTMKIASQFFRTYAVDLWGFGDTSHNVLNYSLEEQAALLDRFLLEMNAGRIALIGHWLGVLIGMMYASRFSRRVDRMMAIGCPVTYDALHPRLKTSGPIELMDWLSTRSPKTLAVLGNSGKNDPQAIIHPLVGWQMNNVHSVFSTLNIPCLLVYGKKDPTILRKPDSLHLPIMSHQIEFGNSGHFPMIDEPDKFNYLLMNFLGLDSGVSPRELKMTIGW